MRYRYYFCEKYSIQLIEFLEKNGIMYKYHKESGEYSHLSRVIFNIYSSAEKADLYLYELQKINVLNPIVFAEYSSADYLKAKLLWMTPKKQCIEIMNEENAYRYSCEWTTILGGTRIMHEEQIAEFVIEKEPSMKTQTAFWCESTGFAEIFTDYRVLEMVKNNSLMGIEFNKVLLRNGSYSEKLFQLSTQNILERECVCSGYGEKIEVCPICGKEQYCINSAYQLHLDFSKIKKQSDLYITEKMFGEGISYPIYIISQKFYQLLKENKLAGNVTFSPVEDVS